MENLRNTMLPFWTINHPYEVHVTVKEAPSYEHFKETCESIGVKAIVLDLHKKSTDVINDVMTSESFRATGEQLVERVRETVEALKNAGYEVIRHKIETVPWHEHAHTHRNSTNYFEVHIPFPVAPEEVDGLRDVISRFSGVHLSRNAMKQSKNGKMVHMLTMRNHEGSYEQFNIALWALKYNLAVYANSIGDPETVDNLQNMKDEVEWAIFDSNVYRDNEWMNNG